MTVKYLFYLRLNCFDQNKPTYKMVYISMESTRKPANKGQNIDHAIRHNKSTNDVREQRRPKRENSKEGE